MEKILLKNTELAQRHEPDVFVSWLEYSVN